MKKWIATTAMALLLTGCGSMTPAPESDLQYQQVHEVDLSQEEIFNKSQEWLAMTFVDSKEVIEVANADTGKIIGKGRAEIAPAGVGVPVRMTIAVEAKPGRYRTTYSDYTGYYGQYRNQPYAISDARSVGQVREQLQVLDADLLEYLKNDSASEDW